jgi:membrane protease subunit HflK
MLPGGGIGAVGVAAIAVVVVVGWLATGFYRVEPQQQGVELVFGELSQTTGPGLNYNLPAPIGEVIVPNVTTINQVDVGYLQLSGGSNREVPEESLMLTGDEKHRVGAHGGALEDSGRRRLFCSTSATPRKA